MYEILQLFVFPSFLNAYQISLPVDNVLTKFLVMLECDGDIWLRKGEAKKFPIVEAHSHYWNIDHMEAVSKHLIQGSMS